MNFLIVVIISIMSVNLYASDSYNLPVYGEQSEEVFILNSIEMRTEYRRENVAKTCYRREFSGYHQACYPESVVFCSNYPSYGHRPGHGPHCVTRIETRCTSQPSYRDVAYTCYETISVPHQVFNQNVRSEVKISINNRLPKNDTASYNCSVNFFQNGQNLTMVAPCLDYVVLANKNTTTTKRGDTLYQYHTVKLDLLDQESIFSPTMNGISQMRLEGQTLTFQTSEINPKANFAINLFVQHKRLLKKDETLIDRDLSKLEYSVENLNNGKSLIRIDLTKLLGGINSKKKHVIKVDLVLLNNLIGAINDHLPSTKISSQITVNN